MKDPVKFSLWLIDPPHPIIDTSLKVCLSLTLRFFFKFVSRANNSYSYQPIKWPKNKNVALEKFLKQTTLKPCNFWAEEALEAPRQDCLNITTAQKWHSSIFQSSVEESFRVWQNGSSTFLCNFGGCNLEKSFGQTSTFIQ